MESSNSKRLSFLGLGSYSDKVRRRTFGAYRTRSGKTDTWHIARITHSNLALCPCIHLYDELVYTHPSVRLSNQIVLSVWNRARKTYTASIFKRHRTAETTSRQNTRLDMSGKWRLKIDQQEILLFTLTSITF